MQLIETIDDKHEHFAKVHYRLFARRLLPSEGS